MFSDNGNLRGHVFGNKMEFPPEVLSGMDYRNMFQNCCKLTNLPDFPSPLKTLTAKDVLELRLDYILELRLDYITDVIASFK